MGEGEEGDGLDLGVTASGLVGEIISSSVEGNPIVSGITGVTGWFGGDGDEE